MTGSGSSGTSLTWDLNNDGTFETTGTSPNFNAAGRDGPSSATIKVRATNGSYTADDTATVNITNVAPTGTTGASAAQLLEGQTGTVSVTGVTDPSAADVAAGFTYSFDFGSDGSYEVNGSSQSTASIPQDLVDGPATLSVTGRVADKDGGSSTSTTSIQMVDVDPTLGVDAPDETIARIPTSINLSISDPAEDGPYATTVDWGDGTTPSVHALPRGSTAVEHAFAIPGDLTIAASTIDVDQVGTDDAGDSIHVTRIGLRPDPCRSGSQLVVVGTDGADEIEVRGQRRGEGLEVEATGLADQTFTDVSSILVLAGPGNDVVRLVRQVNVPSTVFGEQGNDQIVAAPRSAVAGGPGSDRIIGDIGRQVFAGGEGADTLAGRGNDDVLIAGRTAWDAYGRESEQAWCQLVANWTGSGTYQERARALSSSTYSGGSVWLAANVSVWDDGVRDTLRGGPGGRLGADLFYARPGSDRIQTQRDEYIVQV